MSKLTILKNVIFWELLAILPLWAESVCFFRILDIRIVFYASELPRFTILDRLDFYMCHEPKTNISKNRLVHTWLSNFSASGRKSMDKVGNAIMNFQTTKWGLSDSMNWYSIDILIFCSEPKNVISKNGIFGEFLTIFPLWESSLCFIHILDIEIFVYASELLKFQIWARSDFYMCHESKSMISKNGLLYTCVSIFWPIGN